VLTLLSGFALQILATCWPVVVVLAEVRQMVELRVAVACASVASARKDGSALPPSQLQQQARVRCHNIHCHGQLQQRYLAWECFTILCLCQCSPHAGLCRLYKHMHPLINTCIRILATTLYLPGVWRKRFNNSSLQKMRKLSSARYGIDPITVDAIHLQIAF
jgi:hypothetical protein